MTPSPKAVKSRPNLGRIGALAENLRCAARNVLKEMHLSPGGDVYEYTGSTSDVDWLVEKLNELENFQAGWIE